MRRLISASVLAALMATTSVAFAAERQPVPANQVVEVSPINDPIEPFNRAVFQFNRAVDFILLHPLAYVYKNALPTFVQNGVHNFLANLLTPVSMLNELLQGDFQGFETVLHRFVINTTLGAGGLNDVATSLHIPAPAAEDFGQTMGVWGAGHGFYLVLPIIGPSSLRDGTGRIVDAVSDPFNQIMWDSETEWPLYARAGLTAVDSRSRVLGTYDDIMKNSVDPYVTFRSMYVQQRNYVVQDAAGNVDSYSAIEAE